MDKQFIGILLNERVYRGITTGETQHEALNFYEQSAKRLNISVCYFRLCDISIRHMQVKAFIPDRYTYRHQLIPLPKVIHNRGMYGRSQSLRKLSELQKLGIMIYNGKTKYGKLYIHQLLMKNKDLHPHLPETRTATMQHLRDMMRSYRTLIIKPNRGSIGKGIVKLAKKNGRWRLIVPNQRIPGTHRTLAFQSQIPRLLRNIIAKKPYIIQQNLDLATYMGRPFDLRVSVQRNGHALWQITGIVGKVAPARSFLTNVARGGTVYCLEHLLSAMPHLDPVDIRHRIEVLSLQIAEQLSLTLHQLADIGLDIGLTEDGVPLFIECNFKDLRYSFQEGGMFEEWRSTYYQPLSYGVRLLKCIQE